MDTVPKFVQLIKLVQEEVGMGSSRVRPASPAARRGRASRARQEIEPALGEPAEAAGLNRSRADRYLLTLSSLRPGDAAAPRPLSSNPEPDSLAIGAVKGLGL